MINTKLALIGAAGLGTIGAIALFISANKYSCGDELLITEVKGLLQERANAFEQVQTITDIIDVPPEGAEYLRCNATLEYSFNFFGTETTQKVRFAYKVTETVDGYDYIQVESMK